MKKLLSLLIISTAMICTHCDKSNDPNSPNNPNNPNDPGGDITVTSISPEIIYADDIITIKGTGFDPDPAKNLFQMGTIFDGGGFAPYGTEFGADGTFKILSASATELKVQASDPDYIDYTASEERKRPWPFRITVNGKKLVSGFKKVRRLPFCSFERDHNTNVGTGCSLFLCPGDTMFSDGARGLISPCKLYINGVQMGKVSFPDSTKMRCRIPKTLFGDTHDDCLNDQFEFKIINGDGKTFTRDIWMAESPPMFLSSAEFSKSTYSRSGGGVAKLTITGYSLYSTCEVKLSGLDYETTSSLGVGGGFPSQAITEFSLGALPHGGNYYVFLRRDNEHDWGFPIASFFATD